MEGIVDYSPDTLHFHIKPGRQSSTKITLKNISESAIAYKVQTTAPQKYCVSPNTDRMSAHETRMITVMQQAYKALPQNMEYCRDKFQLLVVKLDSQQLLDIPVKELWKKVPKASVLEAKFKVRQSAQVDDAVSGSIEGATENVQSPNDKLRGVVETHHGNPRRNANSEPVRMPQDIPQVSPSSVGEHDLEHACSENQASEQKAMGVEQHSETTVLETPSQSSAVAHGVIDTQTHTPSVKQSPGSVSVSSALSARSEGRRSDTPTRRKSVRIVEPEEKELLSKAPRNLTVAKVNEEFEMAKKREREKVLAVTPAPQVHFGRGSREETQRVAVQRATELYTLISERETEIRSINVQLTEAKHRLSDARIAVKPAYDLSYPVDEDSRIPMPLLSGALLKMLA